jgi:hypothetical protein
MSLDHVSEPGSARRAWGRLAVGVQLASTATPVTGPAEVLVSLGVASTGPLGLSSPSTSLHRWGPTESLTDHQAWPARGALQELAAPKASIRDGAADSVARLYQ